MRRFAQTAAARGPAWAALLSLLLAGCDVPVAPSSDRSPDGGVTGNRPPVLDPIAQRTVEEGQLLRIVVNASDPDGDRLVFDANPIPPNATFDRQFGIFEWTPPLGAADDSPYGIEFSVTDGALFTRLVVVILVNPSPLVIASVTPNRIAQRGGTRLTLSGIGFEEAVRADIAGVAGDNLEVVDNRTVRFDAPDLPNLFGPQSVGLTVADGRSTLLNQAVFVFRDRVDLSGGLGQLAVPDDPRDWVLLDLDGDGQDEVLAVSASGTYRVDPGESWPDSSDAGPIADFDQIDARAARGVGAADFDEDELEDAYVWLDDGAVLALISSDAAEPALLEPLHPAEWPAVAAAVFDLEGDGDTELLVVDDAGDVWVYPPTGGGRFASPIRSSLDLPADANLPFAIELADLDGDGTDDLLLSLRDRFAVAEGVESGGFRPAVLVEASVGFGHPVRSWDAEGSRGWLLASLGRRPDAPGPELAFFTAGEAPGPTAWQAFRFHALDTAVAPAGVAWEGHLADLDGDEVVELASIWADRPALRVDLPAGDGVRLDAWWAVGPISGNPRRGDLDGDGVDELAWLDRQGRRLLTARSTILGPRLDAPRALEAWPTQGLLVGDVNRDGFPDLVAIGAFLGETPFHRLFLGDPDFQFVEAALPAHANVADVVLGDVSGDGWPDVISTAHNDNQLRCFPSAGAVFGEVRLSALEDVPSQLVGVARQLEFGAVRITLVARLRDGRVVRLEDGDGVCRFVVGESLAEQAQLLAVAEVDGDADQDLLVVDQSGGIDVYTQVATDDFRLAEHYDTGLADVRAVAAGDIDGDGATDVVAAGDRLIALASPTSDLGPTSLAADLLLDTDGADWLAVGDLNGDGADDVVAAGDGLPPRLYQVTVESDVARLPSVQRHVLPDWHSDALWPRLADVDLDFDLDLVTIEPGLGIVIWRNEPVP